MHAALLPAAQQPLERAEQAAAFELRVQREHLVACRGARGERQQMIHRVGAGEIGAADQLVERRQRRRQLRYRGRARGGERQERLAAAHVEA